MGCSISTPYIIAGCVDSPKIINNAVGVPNEISDIVNGLEKDGNGVKENNMKVPKRVLKSVSPGEKAVLISGELVAPARQR